MGRRSAALLLAVVTSGTGPVSAAPAPHPAGLPATPQAEIFATNNTSVITDPDDPRLRTRLVRFGHQVQRIIRENGGVPRGSTLVDGGDWRAADVEYGAWEFVG